MAAATQAADRVDLLADAGELGALESEWRALAEARGNPFVTPEWFAAAQAHYEAEPAVVTVRRPGGSLRGLLPLVRPAAEPRRLRFAGAALADSLGPVCARGDEAAVAVAAGPALDLKALGVTAVLLDNVDAEPRWWEGIAGAAPAPLVATRVKGSVLPYAEIGAGGWEEYFAGRSRNFRRDIRRKLARLERDHRLEFRRTASPEQLQRDLAALYRLHDARWEGGGSTAAGERARATISDFAARSLGPGWLRLWLCELDGEPVAGLLQWLVGARVSSYYTGFDPRLQREGVGLVLTAHTLRAAAEEGAREFNMLLGDEPWKQRFSTGARPISTVAVVRARHPARALVAAEAGARRAMGAFGPDAQRRLRSLARPLAGRLPGVRRR